MNLHNNENQVVTHYKVLTLFNKAYAKTTTIRIAKSGFECIDILSYDRDVFPEHLYIINAIGNETNRFTPAA